MRSILRPTAIRSEEQTEETEFGPFHGALVPFHHDGRVPPEATPDAPPEDDYRRYAVQRPSISFRGDRTRVKGTKPD